MPGLQLSLHYRLTAEGPLSAGADGAGLRVRGSTIKGAARRQAVALAQALGLPPCLQDGAAECVLCRLFGAPGVEGALHWSDAAPAQARDAVSSPVAWRTARPRRPVSRALGTAVGGPALVERADAAGETLTGVVEGWLPFATAAEQQRAAALLVGALGLVRRIGGQGDGAGAVRLSVEAVQLGDDERAAGSLLDLLAEMARS